jgi:hypothetical protein
VIAHDLVLGRGAPQSVRAAIAQSGIKPTHTPSVLMSRGPFAAQVAKVVALPEAEREESFLLFIALLGIADGRRRQTECAGGCSHWWHQDLADELLIRRLAHGAEGFHPMQFFKLTHPRYAEDGEADRRNPVTSTATHRVPGVSCDVCGPWSSSRRLRIALPPGLDQFAGGTFLPATDWMDARDRWAALLDVDSNLVEPGARLGPPSGTCTKAVTEDAVHPTPGEIWVTSRVRGALTAAGLTGVSFATVRLSPGCSEGTLAELVVHGTAWRRGSSEETLRLCAQCGRRGFPSPHQLQVDESRWDGSDFLFLDGNPNIVVVTERVAEVVASSGFRNLVAIPLK